MKSLVIILVAMCSAVYVSAERLEHPVVFDTVPSIKTITISPAGDLKKINMSIYLKKKILLGGVISQDSLQNNSSGEPNDSKPEELKVIYLPHPVSVIRVPSQNEIRIIYDRRKTCPYYCKDRTSFV